MPLFTLLTAQRTGALFFTLVGALWNFQAIGGEPLVGWAASGAGTTGGADGPSYSVATAEELSRALKRPSPKTILIRGSITPEDDLRLESDTTLAGAMPGASIRGAGINVRKASNVIVRNLTIQGAVDAINIETSDHVWIDHCDLSRCRDGLVDIKRGSDYITVSWNRFHDHHKTSLLGHSDKPEIQAMDRGKLRVTYHHNYFNGSKSRHPRVRFAEGVHVFNNLYRDCDYGVASVMDAAVIVEGNVFDKVSKPTLIAYGDSPAPGRLVESGNLFTRSGQPQTRGHVPKSLISYKYKLDPVAEVQSLVSLRAGPDFGRD
ncbi:MAG: polysaccharide lyase family 1 protein [Planctomycetota bacterium]